MVKKKMKKMKKKTKPTKKVIAPIVMMVCKDHEDYRAVYSPKEDCLVCWKIYATRMAIKVAVLKTKLKELKNARRR